MEGTIREDMQKCRLHEKYDVITYDMVWKDLKDAEEAMSDLSFGIFVESLRKHSMKSIPETKYEEMKNVFLKRIFNYKGKQE